MGKEVKIELFNEDCMEGIKRYPDKHFDLGIVDPPYGRGEDGGVNRSHNVKQKNGSMLRCKDGGYKKKKWDSKPPPFQFFIELQRVTKERIIWGINYLPINSLVGGCIVWDKVNDGADQSQAEIAHCSLMDRVDMFRYMWRGMMQGESIKNGTKQQGNKKLNEKRIHPTQKPVALYKWLLKNYAKEGDLILDTHLGSGSIAIACWDMGFDLTGFEIDKDYYEAAMKRLEDHKKQGTLDFRKSY